MKTNKRSKRYPTAPTVLDGLTDYVVKKIDYFRQNPSHLAWAMMWYSAINNTWRQVHGWDNYENPKDRLIDLDEEYAGPLNNEDANLVYDAWGITVDNYQIFNDAPEGLGSKPNKTLDEWVEYKTSPEYPHHDLYDGDKYRIWDHILNTIGNGMDWNKDGFICEDGPSGVDGAVYSGYTRCENEIDPKIRAGVKKYVAMIEARPEIGDKVHKYVEKAIENNRRIHAGEDYFDVLDPDRYKRFEADMDRETELPDEIKDSIAINTPAKKEKKKKKTVKPEPIRLYPFSKDYSCLCTMPDNAHPSYVKAGIEMCEMLLDGRAEISHSFAPGEKEKYPDYDKEQRKLAKAFLKKWKRE
jgi:hypothetical protein